MTHLSSMHSKVKTIHMVGIGGSGMCGIAEVLLTSGYRVCGSDMAESPVIHRLRELGAEVFIGHDARNVSDAQVLVKSTAVKMDNPEVMAALEQGVPIIPRAEMLAELMRLRSGIAIAGTHGKTTTTSLTATIFEEAGLDPTVIIGGRLNAYGSNARLGTGEYLLAEADESDGSFLCLLPIMNVVTNVDRDHMDFYASMEAIDAAFVAFMNQVPFYGVNVVCVDDPGVRRLLPLVNRPIITYGTSMASDLRADIHSCGESTEFTVYLRGANLGKVHLGHPGRHNVLNALGAIGVSLQAGISPEVCIRGLSKFKGVGRRFERKGERDGVLVIDDYAHHPAEIAATIATARQCYPDRRLVILFQPHRFSRTQSLFGDFCQCFSHVDKLLLSEIYPASEAPIPGVSGESLAQGIRQVSKTDVTFLPTFDALYDALPTVLQPGDVFITVGAGNVWTLGQRWLDGDTGK